MSCNRESAGYTQNSGTSSTTPVIEFRRPWKIFAPTDDTSKRVTERQPASVKVFVAPGCEFRSRHQVSRKAPVLATIWSNREHHGP
ncbi:MAG: hypothetical protein CMO26_03140 [Thiotrichales bacterium]|nr:hypothetical protein [Thiotrichales bacterium]